MDIGRIDAGELDLPTVSAIRVEIEGEPEDVPVWLEEESLG